MTRESIPGQFSFPGIWEYVTRCLWLSGEDDGFSCRRPRFNLCRVRPRHTVVGGKWKRAKEVALYNDVK